MNPKDELGHELDYFDENPKEDPFVLTYAEKAQQRLALLREWGRIKDHILTRDDASEWVFDEKNLFATNGFMAIQANVETWWANIFEERKLKEKS